MLRSKSFVKRTRRGNIVKVILEHYLRDDISCGSQICHTCKHFQTPKLSSTAEHYLIVDTNVVLHQIDVLENPAITNVIILQTVKDEVRNQNFGLYNRLNAILNDEKKQFFVFSNEHHKETYVDRRQGESMNDRNDRAIRAAAQWYAQHLVDSVPIYLITNDADNLGKAIKEGIQAKTVHDYVKALTAHPELVDLLSFGGDDGAAAAADEGGQGKQAKKKVLFAEHKPLSEILQGVKAKKYLQGTLRANRDNCFEATLTSQSNKFDVLIQGLENMNRAVDGDIVAVELLPKAQWRAPSKKIAERDGKEKSEAETVPEEKRQPTGKVIGIVKRNWRPYCGSIDEKSYSAQSETVLFMPLDKRVPKIRMRTRQAKELMDKRIVVAIDSWDRNSKFPSGHYVATVGLIGDKATESEVILMECDVPHYTFPKAVLDCLPPPDWSITPEEISKRMDLRHIDICSVDPPGCKDIDDALHLRVLPNGNYEVGVHIADVSHFVFEGTALDDEAIKRSTSVYLVDRRIDMLPGFLTETLCSLRGGVERLAFSVIWEMTPNAEIVNTTFGKSVIKSRAAFTYQEAQARIDDSSMQDPLTLSLRHMMTIAKIVRRRRFDSGALELSSPEVKFQLDTESLNPTDVGMYVLRDTNAMVEEYMLLANVSVGEKILQHFPTHALLRRHPAPNPRAFEWLQKALGSANITLDITSSKTLSDSLDKAVVPGNPYMNKLARILTTRCMQQAVYFCTGDLEPQLYHHYGLAAPVYTHFTSPIRRYADVIVHRLLAASLGIAPLSDNLTTKSKVREIANNINYRHKMAQSAGRGSVELHTLLFFRGRTETEDAFVIKIKSNAIVVLVPRYGIEGIIYLHDSESPTPNPFNFDEKTQTLTCPSRSGGFNLKIFQQVRVRIHIEETQNKREKVVIELVSPAPPAGISLPAASLRAIPLTEEQDELPDGEDEDAKERKKLEESKQVVGDEADDVVDPAVLAAAAEKKASAKAPAEPSSAPKPKKAKKTNSVPAASAADESSSSTPASTTPMSTSSDATEKKKKSKKEKSASSSKMEEDTPVVATTTTDAPAVAATTGKKRKANQIAEETVDASEGLDLNAVDNGEAMQDAPAPPSAKTDKKKKKGKQ